MHRGIKSFERQWDYDATYVHQMINASPRAAWLFSRVASLGKYRRDIPVTPDAPAQSPPSDTKIVVRVLSSP
jgi:hypothetical protein